VRARPTLERDPHPRWAAAAATPAAATAAAATAAAVTAAAAAQRRDTIVLARGYRSNDAVQ